MSTDSGDDSPEYVCGYDGCSTKDEPCQFPVSGPDERCHAHPKDGSGPPEGHGSGDPDHRKGNGTGDIVEKSPPEDKPAMKHGLHAVEDDPRGTLDWLEDNDPRGYRWVRKKWSSYMADAGFGVDTAKADDVLHACLMLYAVRGARHQQVTRGLTEKETLTDEGDVVIDPATGDPIQVEREHAANLPANRIAREARTTLRDLGLLNDPESQKADAMKFGQAARNVAERIDSQSDADDGRDVVDVDAEQTDT